VCIRRWLRFPPNATTGWGHHNLVFVFSNVFFEGAVFGARDMFVPGNKMSAHRTRCPDAVLLVASQGAPVVYWHYTAHCIAHP
jgi:hypothetical protein